MGQTIGTKLAFLPPHVSYMPHSFRFIEKSNRKDDSPGIPFRFFKYSEFQDLNDTYTIIFSHGNAHDLGMCLTYTESIAKALECNLISYDYTGYVLNYGTPNEENCVEDLHDVFEYLLSIGVKKEKIILMGHSIGGGVTLSFIRKYLYNKEIDRYENFDMPYEEDDDMCYAYFEPEDMSLECYKWEDLLDMDEYVDVRFKDKDSHPLKDSEGNWIKECSPEDMQLTLIVDFGAGDSILKELVDHIEDDED